MNHEVNYLSRPQDLVLLPGVPRAIREAQRQGWLVVVITNQSGVARGYLTLETLQSIHSRLDEALAEQGVALDGLYFCPHHPDDHCDCRKPMPGMLYAAAGDLNIDLAQSWMIGDMPSDLVAGRRAGCHTALVLTGHGARSHAAGVDADLVALDLTTAIEHILGREQAA